MAGLASDRRHPSRGQARAWVRQPERRTRARARERPAGHARGRVLPLAAAAGITRSGAWLVWPLNTAKSS